MNGKSITSYHTFIMPSNLRFSIAASPSDTLPISTRPQTIAAPPPAKKQKMSLRQTYLLANKARGKMTVEASRGDHDLRLLVGHANFLDGLIADLAEAEREQESWFNHSVRSAVKASAAAPKHVQWADHIPEEAVEDDEDEDEDEEDEDEDQDEQMEYSGVEPESDEDYIRRTAAVVPPPRRRSPQIPTVTATEVSEDMEIDEDYEDDLALTRTPSHPPELMHESDSDSDDDLMPPSPPQPNIPLDVFSEKQRQAIATTSFYQSIPDASDTAVASLPPSEQASFFDEGFYLPQRQPHTAIVGTY